MGYFPTSTGSRISEPSTVPPLISTTHPPLMKQPPCLHRSTHRMPYRLAPEKVGPPVRFLMTNQQGEQLTCGNRFTCLELLMRMEFRSHSEILAHLTRGFSKGWKEKTWNSGFRLNKKLWFKKSRAIWKDRRNWSSGVQGFQGCEYRPQNNYGEIIQKVTLESFVVYIFISFGILPSPQHQM